VPRVPTAKVHRLWRGASAQPSFLSRGGSALKRAAKVEGAARVKIGWLSRCDFSNASARLSPGSHRAQGPTSSAAWLLHRRIAGCSLLLAPLLRHHRPHCHPRRIRKAWETDTLESAEPLQHGSLLRRHRKREMRTAALHFGCAAVASLHFRSPCPPRRPHRRSRALRARTGYLSVIRFGSTLLPPRRIAHIHRLDPMRLIRRLRSFAMPRHPTRQRHRMPATTAIRWTRASTAILASAPE
jgi:hypothetical protein